MKDTRDTITRRFDEHSPTEIIVKEATNKNNEYINQQFLINHLIMDNRTLLENEAKVRAEAIKDFAERLIAMLAKYDMYGTLYIAEDIDNLVKEMVGADDGK